MGSQIGTLKVAAKRLGLTFDEYVAKVNSGLKRCTTCKEWVGRENFSKDNSRGDGFKASCFGCNRVKERIITKGRASAFKGHSHSPEARKKISQTRIGNPGNRTKKLTPEQKAFISKRTKESTNYRGENHKDWKGGIKPLVETIRHSHAYVAWRTEVFTRDKFTCQLCSDKKGGNLNAHHIKPFATFAELRFEISNGITLCESCHEATHAGTPRIRSV